MISTLGAEAYGFDHHAERVLGKALAEWFSNATEVTPFGKREDVVIISKFGKHVGEHAKKYTGPEILQALNDSLAALQTNYIDLYLVRYLYFSFSLHLSSESHRINIHCNHFFMYYQRYIGQAMWRTSQKL